MLANRTPKNLPRRSLEALGLLAVSVAVCIAVQSASVAAVAADTTACAQWDLTGQPWTVNQGGFRIQFTLKRRDATIGGVAQYFQPDEYQRDGWTYSRAPGYNITGTDKAAVAAAVKGRSIEIRTVWGAVYVGSIDPSGRAAGETYFKGADSTRGKWSSVRPLACARRAASSSSTNAILSGPIVPAQETAPSKASTPGSTQGLNPQPLPPRSALGAAQPASGVRLNSGRSPAVLAIGAAQSLNPQPLPPQLPMGRIKF